MSDELKPCPFCGGTNIHIPVHDDGSIFGWVQCLTCECDGPLISEIYVENKRHTAATKEKIIEAWNKRYEK
jgi:Lar family restriction alleviation protein